MTRFLLSFLLLFPTLLAAQSIAMVPPVKKIEVTGSAEREITPDEIWFAISLREYKDGSRKVEIDALEKQLVSAIEALKIPRENLRIDNVSSSQNYWEKKRNTEFLASKRYLIKLTELSALNPLLDRLDAKGIQSTYVQGYSHTKIDQYRQELKIAALKAARTKAEGLLSAINEKIGGTLEVYEQGDMVNAPMEAMSNMRMKASFDATGGAPEEIDFKTIKLRAEMRAVFAIQ